MTDDADALRRQDVTCASCGARSRTGYPVPTGRHCQRENHLGDRVTVQHDWQPTDEVADG